MMKKDAQSHHHLASTLGGKALASLLNRQVETQELAEDKTTQPVMNNTETFSQWENWKDLQGLDSERAMVEYLNTNANKQKSAAMRIKLRSKL